jgi:hypothetical protein
MKLSYRPLLVPTLIASALFATSCSFGAHEAATDEADRPQTEDVGALANTWPSSPSNTAARSSAPHRLGEAHGIWARGQ